jgi:hypothetical protein
MQNTKQKQARLDMLDWKVQRVDARLAALKQRESRFPWLRVAVFLAGGALTTAAFLLPQAWAGWLTLLLALAVFAVVAALHRNVLRAIERTSVLQRLAVGQVARARLDWAHIPSPPDVPNRKDHPFEFDLNITGPNSLHQLLDTAASTGGSARLRGWLLAQAPDVAATARHHRLTAELLPLTGFRARLQLASALALNTPGERWDGEAVLAWLGRETRAAELRPYLIALLVVSAANIAALLLFVTGMIPAILWLAIVALFWGLQGLKYRETSELFVEAYGLARSLNQFNAVLRELESYPYPPGSALADAARAFRATDTRPSRSLRRLSWIVSAAGLRNNAFLSLMLNTLLPWDMFFTYLLEQYKTHLRSSLPAWLDAWYELEAATSLANFALLNPDYTYPTLSESADVPGGAVFHAEAVGHPLLPDAARVTNSFAIQDLGEVFIITGSNMSGKSTFLRTIGVNLVLANAGAVVCARQFSALPFRLYTCINLSDSLSDGISYFYAEVRRLKGLLDALEQDNPFPLFFLIDEIFRGTNNRERQQGSQAYTQALAGKRGTGLISTHDLELAHLAQDVPGVRNFHFREDVRDGRMVFDFLLRPGPSPTTNALKIMAMEGLPTEPIRGN